MNQLIRDIRQLWARERSQGTYSPIDELTLDLETLDDQALRALYARISMRVNRTRHRRSAIV